MLSFVKQNDVMVCVIMLNVLAPHVIYNFLHVYGMYSISVNDPYIMKAKFTQHTPYPYNKYLNKHTHNVYNKWYILYYGI